MKRQVDYNKIASNLFKYSFAFDLTVEDTYENFSKEYPEIYNKIIQIYNDENPTPFIICDSETTGSLLIKNVVDYSGDIAKIEFRSSNVVDGQVYFQLFEYNFKTDIFKFTNTLEEYVSIDNVKSVFNQKIIGTGNITLFRHKLRLIYESSSGDPDDVYLDWLSTSNLNVDSIQDLQTLLKVSRNDTSDTEYLGYSRFSTLSILFSHSTGVFKIIDEYGEYNVGGVSDIVTTI